MTLDYTKMFLIVTEEAVVKGHFTCMHMWAMRYGLHSTNRCPAPLDSEQAFFIFRAINDRPYIQEHTICRKKT